MPSMCTTNLECSNTPPFVYPESCLHELFFQQATRTPEKIAVIDGDRQLTFSELAERVAMLAAHLKECGVERDKIVPIFMPRCLEFVIAYIAVLTAGGAYLPLEIGYPIQQLARIVSECKPVIVLASESVCGRLPKDTHCFTLTEGWEKQFEGHSREGTPVLVDIDDLAYCVYSSGTTGEPKGILCPHRGAVLSYTHRSKIAPYDTNEREACNVFFVWELLRPLLNGATLVVVPDHVIYDPSALLELLEKQRVTRMLFTPSLIEAVINSPALDEVSIRTAFQYFRVIVLCGETVTHKLRNQILTISPEKLTLLNLYSISECHDVSITNLADDETTSEKYCHVGTTLPGVDLHVLREDPNDKDKLEVVPMGVEGKIFISGPTLARAYLARPGLTMSRFIERPRNIPVSPRIEGQDMKNSGLYSRLYDTGDVGRVLPSGHVQVLRRHDTMQKVRGYSVELQAIEGEVLKIAYVSSCSIQIIGDEGDDKHIVAFVVLNTTNGSKDTLREIRRALKHVLPHYMVPSFIVPLQSLPTHPISGKLDSRALPSTVSSVLSLLRTKQYCYHTRKLSNTEIVVSKLWSETLAIPSELLDIEESFFDQGGHSLLASQLIAKLCMEFKAVKLRVSHLYQYSTVKQLSLYLDGEAKNDSNEFSDDIVAAEINDFLKHTPKGFDLVLQAYWHGVSHSDTQCRSQSNLNSTYDAMQKRRNCLTGTRVLLTGSTGFLGAFLLHDLLKRENGPLKIYCIVRASDSQTPLERVISSLARYGLWKHETQWNTKIEAVEGDLEVDRFGLPDADYLFLTTAIDHIIHCGAKVNLVFPYSALRNVNVLSARRLLHFAMDTKVKEFTYISTNAVFPNSKSHQKDIDIRGAMKLNTGYAQSKYVAEQLVTCATRLGLPTMIFRPGNIGGSTLSKYSANYAAEMRHDFSSLYRQNRGDSTTQIRESIGKLNIARHHGLKDTIHSIGWNSGDMNLLFFLGCALVGKFPSIANWLCELTPVDFVARSIVTITFDKSVSHRVFNMANNSRLPMRDFFEEMRGFGVQLKEVHFEEFQESLHEAIRANEQSDECTTILRPLMQVIQSVENSDDLTDTNTYEIDAFQQSCFHNGLGEIPRYDRKLAIFYCKQFQASVLKSLKGKNGGALHGKVALVTGASGGIGEAIARMLASAGAHVCLAARRMNRISALSEEIERQFSVRVLAVKTDVTDRQSVQHCAQEAEKFLGPINILVNNAGVMHYNLVQNLLEDEWMEAIDVNIKGVLNTTAVALPRMLELEEAHIINISSNAGKVAFAGLAVYTGTKFFVEGFSESLRKEMVGTGVKITTVQPGDCRTEISKCTTDAVARKQFSQTSTERNVWLDPEDVARTVLWVVSQPSHVTVGEVRIEPRDAPA